MDTYRPYQLVSPGGSCTVQVVAVKPTLTATGLLEVNDGSRTFLLYLSGHTMRCLSKWAKQHGMEDWADLVGTFITFRLTENYQAEWEFARPPANPKETG